MVPGCFFDANGLNLKQVCGAGLDGNETLTLGIAIVGLVGLGTLILWPRVFALRAGKTLFPRAGWPLYLGLPEGPAEVIPRDREMAGLKRRLDRGGTTVIEAVVSGMGGNGKTTLALAAARDLANRFEGVWLVSAASPATIVRDFKALAYRLDCPEARDPSDEAAAKAALRRVRDRGKPWLLIYDNADRPEYLEGWRPGRGQVRVLITSRSTAWDDHQTMKLDRMQPDEALALLTSRLGAHRPEGDLAVLVKRLDFWPLGIVAAAGYLRRHRGKSVQEYVTGFDASKAEMGKLDWPDSAYFAVDRPETHSLAAALDVSIADLSDDDRDLLLLFSFLNPDDLWPEMVQKGLASELADPFGEALTGFATRAGAGPDRVEEGLARLAERSLVDHQDGFWRLHRPTGEFWRARRADAGERHDLAARVVNAATPFGTGNAANWGIFRRV